MSDQPHEADIAAVEPFDLTGIPGKRFTVVCILTVLVVGVSTLMSVILTYHPETFAGQMWLLFGVFAWISAIGIAFEFLTRKYERLYKFVQRGVVSEIKEDSSLVTLKGYTGANIYLEQECYVPPRFQYQEAKVGQVIDLAEIRRTYG